MGVLHLFAVSIDDLRDLFAASDAATSRLRALAAATWPTPPPPPPKGNLLSKLGPFARRATGAPIVRPGEPTGADLDAVVHGRDVAEDRRSAAWALVRLWLTDSSFGHLEVAASEGEIDEVDFALSAAGLEPRLSLRNLFRSSLGVPLKAQPGQTTGYLRGDQAVALASGWRQAAGRLAAPHPPLVEQLTGWLSQFETWHEQNIRPGQRRPDLVAWFQMDAPDQAISSPMSPWAK